MTVNEIPVNIRCIEFKQQEGDAHYGSCLYARFYLNCDKYEMTIISDCGNYGYKWHETPDYESFLELVARMDGDYLLNKIYGSPDVFDFDKTKENLIKQFNDADEDVQEALKDVFEGLEYTPTTSDDFIRLFENERQCVDTDIFDTDTLYYTIEHTYPADALKIIEVFEQNIQPFVKQLLQEETAKE